MKQLPGANPGFLLGGGAHSHIVFFLQNQSCIRKWPGHLRGVRIPCTLPLDPPLTKLCVCIVLNVVGYESTKHETSVGTK